MSRVIPKDEKEAVDWFTSFIDNVAARPGEYAITSGQGQNLSRVVSLFLQARTAAANPKTRTKAAIDLKNQRLADARALAMQYVRLIKPNLGVSNQSKLDAGIPLPGSRDPSPIQVPASSPGLAILGGTPGAQTVEYFDPMDKHRRAKPFGAASLQLFVAVDDVPAPVEDARFVGNFTRNPMGVPFEKDQNQKIATYFGRWQNRRGDTGPWSNPVCMTIAA